MMQRRVIAMLLTVVMVLSMLPLVVVAEEEEHVHCMCGAESAKGVICAECNTEAVNWAATDVMPTETGYYYLTGAVSTASVSYIGQNVSICLHGKQLASASGNRIMNISEAVVNITDCTATTDAEGNYKAGIITGCNKDNNGSTLRVLAGGQLNLYEGKITGNSVTGDATIYVDKSDSAAKPAGVFNMYGGEISGNTARRGAGVYGVSNGTNYPVIRLLGGTITGNTGTGTGGTGGGAGVVSFRPVEIGGDMKIYGNTAAAKPADLFLRNDGAFTGALVLSTNVPLKDGAQICYGLKVAEEDLAALQSVDGAPENWSADWLVYDGQKVGFADGNFFVQTEEPDVHVHCLCAQEKTKGKICEQCGTKAVEWTGINKMPAITAPGYYFLTADVSVAPFFVTEGDFAFCLCGHTMTSAAGKRMFSASNGASISFTDCAENAGTITGTTGASNYGSLMAASTGGTLNLYNGKITGNTGAAEGLIYLAAGTLGGRFNMYGGEISGNMVKRGIVMTALATSGKLPGEIRLLGGTITGNTATGTGSLGGGAGVLTFYPIEVGGNAKVYGNTAAAGVADIYLRNDQSAELVISEEKPLSGDAKLVCGLYEKEADSANLQYVIGEPENWDTAWITYEEEPLRYEEGVFTIAKVLVYSEHDHDSHQWVSVTNENKQWPVSEGYYVLEEDVQLDQLLIIPQGVQVHLCLNGKTLKAAEGFHHFDLRANATLTICDCTAKTAEDGTYTAGQITGANAAAGGAFRVRAGATVNLYDGKITENCSTTDGGAFYVDGCSAANTEPAALNMYGGEISYNSAPAGMGGAIRFAAPAEGCSAAIFRMEAGRICNNEALKYGGVIHAPSGAKIQLLGGIIENNASQQGGGAISVNGVSTLELSGTVIRNNTAAVLGGGVYVKNGAVMNMTGGEVSGNSAPVGGGIRVESAATVLNLQDGIVSGNKSTGNGGGIFSSANTTVNMTGGQILDNISGGDGGGIALSNATGSFTGGVINKNQATKNGGGVALLGSRVTLGKVKIAENKASASGGGVYIARAVSVKSDVIIDGADIIGNNSKQYGGGVYLYMNGNTLTMESGTIAENSAKSGGGGVLTVREVSFTMNGGEIRDNSTTSSGGGLYVSEDSTFVMNGGSFSGNYAEKNGGGIRVRLATAKFNGGSVSYNTAKSAVGGVYFLGAKGSLAGTWITNNKCLEGSGGGVMLARTTKTVEGAKIPVNCYVTMTGGRISGNTTPKAGAGLLIQSQGTVFEMYGGEIRENVSTKFGAGVYVGSGSTFNMHGGKICYNMTENDAAGGVRHDGAGNYTGGEIFGNISNRSAGGMLVARDGNVVNIKGVKIYDNKAKIGAGIMVQNKAVVNMEECQIVNNHATLNGGGIYTYSNGTLNLTNCVLQDNTAQSEGGGAYLAARTYLNMDNCTVENNEAKEGGGGAVCSTGFGLTVKNSIIRNNKAAGSGGACYAGLMAAITGRDALGVVLENTVFEKNTSGGQGGALFLSSGAATKMNAVTFTENLAAAEGGAFWAKDELSLQDVTVSNNSSGGEGFAVYLAESDYDGHSFIAGLMKFSGHVRICDNRGGDLYLGKQTPVVISDFGEDSLIHVTLYSGLLTQWVRGSYHYEGGDLVYTITSGNRSIVDPEIPVQNEEPVEEPTQGSEPVETPTQGEQKEPKGNAGLFIGIGAVIAVIAAATVIIVAAASKKKKVTK